MMEERNISESARIGQGLERSVYKGMSGIVKGRACMGLREERFLFCFMRI